LSIRVRWPLRDLPNFKAQVIPFRSRAVRLTTRNGASELVDSRTLARNPGVAEASASIYLVAGDGYSVLAQAFAESDPAGGATPIAQGTAANVPIRAGKTVQVPITLTAAYAPTITGLNPGSAPFGSDVTITGTNFGASLGLDFAVTFAGVAAAATRSSDTQAIARVPVGPSGNVVVIVDGVPSTSVAPFATTQGFVAAVLESFALFERSGLLVTVRDSGLQQATPPPAPGNGNVGAGLSGTTAGAATPAPTPGAGTMGANLNSVVTGATPAPTPGAGNMTANLSSTVTGATPAPTPGAGTVSTNLTSVATGATPAPTPGAGTVNTNLSSVVTGATPPPAPGLGTIGVILQ